LKQARHVAGGRRRRSNARELESSPPRASGGSLSSRLLSPLTWERAGERVSQLFRECLSTGEGRFGRTATIRWLPRDVGL
jgi:hypothetical protein